jgi:hypothetical protein
VLELLLLPLQSSLMKTARFVLRLEPTISPTQLLTLAATHLPMIAGSLFPTHAATHLPKHAGSLSPTHLPKIVASFLNFLIAL